LTESRDLVPSLDAAIRVERLSLVSWQGVGELCDETLVGDAAAMTGIAAFGRPAGRGAGASVALAPAHPDASFDPRFGPWAPPVVRWRVGVCWEHLPATGEEVESLRSGGPEAACATLLAVIDDAFGPAALRRLRLAAAVARLRCGTDHASFDKVWPPPFRDKPLTPTFDWTAFIGRARVASPGLRHGFSGGVPVIPSPGAGRMEELRRWVRAEAGEIAPALLPDLDRI